MDPLKTDKPLGNHLHQVLEFFRVFHCYPDTDTDTDSYEYFYQVLKPSYF